MPRPELLSPAQRAALMAPPSDLNECIGYYTLSANDLHLIRQHRGIHNQLGLPASAWSEYAKRDQTRREHLQELQRHSGLWLLTVADYRSLAA